MKVVVFPDTGLAAKRLEAHQKALTYHLKAEHDPDHDRTIRCTLRRIASQCI